MKGDLTPPQAMYLLFWLIRIKELGTLTKHPESQGSVHAGTIGYAKPDCISLPRLETCPFGERLPPFGAGGGSSARATSQGPRGLLTSGERAKHVL